MTTKTLSKAHRAIGRHTKKVVASPKASSTTKKHKKSERISISRIEKLKIRLRSTRVVRVHDVRKRLGISQPELARLLGYSVRAVAGWESGKQLSEAAKHKIIETERLRLALAEIVPSAKLGEWMRTSNSAFEGQTPIQVIESGESDRIWRLIFQIDANVAS